jgi:DNA-binding MarR family transcriptional regulator
MDASNPVTAALQEWIGVFMRRSTRNLLLYAKESGLSMSQVGALLHIHQAGVSAVSDLGDDLGISTPAASQMLDRLVQQELVARSEDPHDRRMKQIALTAKGRQVLLESIRARQSWLDDLAPLLTPAEQEQVIAALRILIRRANQLQEPQADR